jgi:hypothetical protein
MVSWKGSPGCKIKFKEMHFYGRKVLDFAEQQSKTISQHKGQLVFRSSRGDRPTVRFTCPLRLFSGKSRNIDRWVLAAIPSSLKNWEITGIFKKGPRKNKEGISPEASIKDNLFPYDGLQNSLSFALHGKLIAELQLFIVINLKWLFLAIVHIIINLKLSAELGWFFAHSF